MSAARAGVSPMMPVKEAATHEVAAAFAGYEAALVANDRPGVLGYFLDSADLVRFGVADHQVGTAQLRAWRAGQPPLPAGRRLADTRIAVLDAGTAIVTTLFTYPDRPCVGRQSQTWTRTGSGWRIAGAHVSELPAAADPAGAHKLHLPGWSDYKE